MEIYYDPPCIIVPFILFDFTYIIFLHYGCQYFKYKQREIKILTFDKI